MKFPPARWRNKVDIKRWKIWFFAHHRLDFKQKMSTVVRECIAYFLCGCQAREYNPSLLYIPAKFCCYIFLLYITHTWHGIILHLMLYSASTIVQMLVEPASAKMCKSQSQQMQIVKRPSETGCNRNKLTWPVKNWKWQNIFQRFGDAAKRQLEAKWDMEVDKEGTIDVVDRYLQV